MRRLPIALLFLALAISSASAQVVPKECIGEFTGTLSVVRVGRTWQLASPQFATWSVEKDAWTLERWKDYRDRTQNSFVACVGNGKSGPRRLGSTGFNVVPLNDKFGHENGFRVLSFWEEMGDSLRLRRIAPMVFSGGVGDLRVVDELVRENGTVIVVGMNNVVDTAEISSSYDFLLFNPKSLEVLPLHSASYYWAFPSRCDTLSFELEETEKGVYAVLHREFLDFVWEPPEYRAVRTGEETTRVVLVE